MGWQWCFFHPWTTLSKSYSWEMVQLANRLLLSSWSLWGEKGLGCFSSGMREGHWHWLTPKTTQNVGWWLPRGNLSVFGKGGHARWQHTKEQINITLKVSIIIIEDILHKERAIWLCWFFLPEWNCNCHYQQNHLYLKIQVVMLSAHTWNVKMWKKLGCCALGDSWDISSFVMYLLSHI